MAKTICIIEDMKPIRKLLITILQKAGFETVDFPDAKSSLEWLQMNIPVCIVMDILLPDINGTELLQQVRKMENGASIPIIAVTGFAQGSDHERYLKSGFDAYFAKPINTATFPDDVKKVIENKK